MPDTNRCAWKEQDLVLYLYDDLPPADRAAVESHLAGCEACRAAASALRSTLGAVDAAGIPERLAARELPDWDAEWRLLRRRLEASRFTTGRPHLVAPWLKAAAVLLLAGASFVVGRQWESLSGIFGPGGPGSSFTPEEALALPDGSDRLQFFSEHTHGYLNRSRIVLLEFANAREAGDSKTLRQASLKLLRETKSARAVAGKLSDPRIDELLAQLENILGEISRLSDAADATTANRIRAEVTNSGVLDQLELLSSGSARLAQERS